MSFTEKFRDYVCVGDSISCTIGDYTITARLEGDENGERPDERQDGFWPSFDRNEDGFIGDGKIIADFAAEQENSKSIMETWERDEWFYCGVILSVKIEDIELTRHATSLWGLEANFLDTKNENLTQTANELLPEALEVANGIRIRWSRVLGRLKP